MSAQLTPRVSSEFASAPEIEKFFSRKDINKIRSDFEPREQPVLGVPGKSCETNLFFGFFFDGTTNNYIQAESIKNHSNFARLYDCYPGLSVPGVLPPSTDGSTSPKDTRIFLKCTLPASARHSLK